MAAKEIDPETVRRAAEAGLTPLEIAQVLGVDCKRMMRQCAKEVEAGLAAGVAQIKLRLYRMGMEGNIAALIFALKNRAGWSDHNTVSGNPNSPIEFKVTRIGS